MPGTGWWSCELSVLFCSAQSSLFSCHSDFSQVLSEADDDDCSYISWAITIFPRICHALFLRHHIIYGVLVMTHRACFKLAKWIGPVIFPIQVPTLQVFLHASSVLLLCILPPCNLRFATAIPISYIGLTVTKLHDFGSFSWKWLRFKRDESCSWASYFSAGRSSISCNHFAAKRTISHSWCVHCAAQIKSFHQQNYEAPLNHSIWIFQGRGKFI